MIKCPICDKEINNRRVEHLEYSIGEEYMDCKDEYHYYSYMFAYGNEEEVIGNVVFRRHHADPKEQRDLISKQFEVVSKLEKEQYLFSKSQGGSTNE